MIVLLLTVMLARFQRGDEKAFWFGFALFGWSFFLLGFGPWMNLLADGEGAEELLNPNLLTSKAIFFLVSRFRKKPDDFQDIEKITANTIRIAHLLTTLCLALCGGMIGAMVRRRRGKIVSVKSLSILAALAVITALGSLGFSSNPPVLFFPDLAFDEEKDHSDFVAKWYSKHLRAMGEPSLWAHARDPQNPTVYRLLWLPTFRHPVCVRIHRTPSGATLHATVLDGKGGYEPGFVAIERDIVLSEKQWIDMSELVERAGFWDMPTRLEDDGGCDGDQLIVEGLSGAKYHLVDRWEAEGHYERLCRQMLDLTGLNVQRNRAAYH